VTSLRVALVEAALVLVVALAATSAARSLPDTWSLLSSQHNTYARLTDRDPNVVPGYDFLLPSSALRLFAHYATRGRRFYVQTREGPFIAGVDYPTAVRTLARYELLPAREVTDPHEADVVFSVGVDPALLGLRYQRIERARGSYAAAQVRRPR
jgi:hypothetical protein